MWLRLTLSLVLLALLSGCETLSYYAQSARGQLAVMAASESIDRLVMDESVDADLKARLTKVKVMRRFAVEELHLPDNDSYLDYVDVNREAMVWTVLATPAYQLTPKQWCYPVVGCAAYRGYFGKADASAYAQRLRAEGLDVAVLPVPAYSTLGWFDDPLPSTVVNWPKYDLAGLIFHELAHQKVYIKGDSQFNESYATLVEEEGVRRWLNRHDDQELIAQWQLAEQRQQDFYRLLQTVRDDLLQLYLQPFEQAKMEHAKQSRLQRLQGDYQQLKTSWNGYAGYDAWMAQSPNNAHLAGINLYRGLVPALRVLLESLDGDMAAFHRQCAELASLTRAQRQQTLESVIK